MKPPPVRPGRLLDAIDAAVTFGLVIGWWLSLRAQFAIAATLSLFHCRGW